jgi:hypothetical protein
MGDLMEPTTSTAAGLAGWKLITWLATMGTIGAGLAALVVMCMTPPRDKREWVVGLVSTVVGSVGGGAAAVQYFALQYWAYSFFGSLALFGLVFLCGLPAWAMVRLLFNTIRRNDAAGSGLDDVVRELRK